MATALGIGSASRTEGSEGKGCAAGGCAGPRSIGPLQTMRTDRWWLAPLRTGIFLGGLTAYATWAALQTTHFAVGSYISPLFSPCVAADCGRHADVVVIGNWWRLSRELLVVNFAVGVRAACSNYRKVCYGSFWLSPPACAVDEPRRRYRGKSRFPSLLQNAPPYFWMAHQ